MYIFIGAFIGFIVGVFITIVHNILTKLDGELQIDESDGEKDIFRFVVYSEIEDIKKKKNVRFKVIKTSLNNKDA